MHQGKTRIGRLCLMILSLLAAVFLSSYTETDDFFRYTEDGDGNLHIVSYEGYDHDLTIPGEIGGKKVVAVDETAFYGNATVRRITVSAGIARIEKDAFAYCENLNRVTFKDGSGDFLGEAAFEGCALLERVDFPGNLTEIDDFAFRGCVRLGTLTMPASLTRIGYHAFADCESLVFHAQDSPVALAYAEENGIDLSGQDSSAFLWGKVAALCALALAILAGMYFLLRRRKNQTAASAADPKGSSPSAGGVNERQTDDKKSGKKK